MGYDWKKVLGYKWIINVYRYVWEMIYGTLWISSFIGEWHWIIIVGLYLIGLLYITYIQYLIFSIDEYI